MDAAAIKGKRLLFVTGKLASKAVEQTVAKLAGNLHFQFDIIVLPITVAALMSGKWTVKNLNPTRHYDFIIVPGYLSDEVEYLQQNFSTLIVAGPKDIRDLSQWFGQSKREDDYGEFNIEIVAEINYAERLTRQDLMATAERLRLDGADIIDLGCDPNRRWNSVGDAVKLLREKNIRCSIDTFDTWEAEQATRHGAQLVLSVNTSNLQAATQWNAEVVVVPDRGEEEWLASVAKCVNFLDQQNVPLRIDPILDPIGCGFTDSLERYRRIRAEFPNHATMMGIGNITELTDVDSAGLNVLLLSICQELRVTSVLTTQVINWARSSVAECDIARRLAHYSVTHSIPPKRIDSRLVMLRDPKLETYSQEFINDLAASIRDNNYRIVIDERQIHLIAAGVHLRGTDPFAIMEELMGLPQSENVDSSHAFYLGLELNKAATALQLGKRYEQDQALQWGHLTIEESRHRLKRTYRRGK